MLNNIQKIQVSVNDKAVIDDIPSGPGHMQSSQVSTVGRPVGKISSKFVLNDKWEFIGSTKKNLRNNNQIGLPSKFSKNSSTSESSEQILGPLEELAGAG